MFRFGTKKDYFSAGSRKQVWLTPKTLQLFKAMLDLGWVSKAYEAIPPEYAKKQQGGLVTIYCRSLPFNKLLENLKEEDVEVDEDTPWVELRDEQRVLLLLPTKYVNSDSYRRTVDVLQRH